MSIFRNIYNSVNKFFTPNSQRISSEFFNDYWQIDGLTNDLLKTLNDCGRLLLERNPRMFVNFSDLVYNIMPLYQKAIRLRTIFLGTVKITNISKTQNARIQQTITFIHKIPIYDSNTLVPSGYGVNTLLNMVSEDCDKFGMAFCQLIYNKVGTVTGIQIFKPTSFYFGYNDSGVKTLFYGDGTVVDINSIYIFRYQTVRGFDWGTPLIYGNKFMGDNLIKLLNAQVSGLMRNMNPFDLTIISTDMEKLIDLPEDQQVSIKKGIEKLKIDVKKAAELSLQGESLHLLTNIPTVSSVNNIKANSTITFIDPKTLGIFIELFCAGMDNIPYQLMMDTTGSMSTDKYKSALLMMEAWASQFARPQKQPIISKMVTDIFYANGMPITDSDIKVELIQNEQMMQSLVLGQTQTQNPTPTPLGYDEAGV